MEMNFDKRICENRICDVCDTGLIVKCTMMKTGTSMIFYCETCWNKEMKTIVDHENQARQVLSIPSQSHQSTPQISVRTPAPIAINSVLREAAEIDQKVEVRADLFNAATKSIIELKAAIEADSSITNKPYALAEALKARFEHHKTVVFDLNQKLVEAGNQQKAIQIYLNTLANTLRAEEREKLKISDISYKPAPPKAIKVAKSPGTTTTKKKIDKKEVREAAARLGVSEFMVQMIVVQKGITVAEAETLLKASIAAAQAKA